MLQQNVCIVCSVWCYMVLSQNSVKSKWRQQQIQNGNKHYTSSANHIIVLDNVKQNEDNCPLQHTPA